MKYRLILLPFYLLLFSCAQGQVNIAGNYFNHFGSRLNLLSDSSFNYSYRFDLSSSWSNGIWTVESDTIFLTTVAIYDTLEYSDTLEDGSVVNKKEIVLSSDDKSNKISLGEAFINEISSGGQNRSPNPHKLFYKHNRLYDFNINGDINRKRIRGFWTRKKYAPYYIKE